MKIEPRSVRRRAGMAALAAAGLVGAGLLTAAPASAAAPVYVALGDSMASGPLVPDIRSTISSCTTSVSMGVEGPFAAHGS